MAARLLGLGALVFVVAACGAQSVQTEGAARSAPGTARFETVVGASGDVDLSGDPTSSGIVDFARDRREVRYSDGYRVIVIGSVVYWELHADIPVPHGKRWERFDGSKGEAEFLETLHAGSHNLQHVFIESAAGSPAGYLDYLRDVSRSAPTRIGEEEVRGIRTVHYRALLDNRRFWRREVAQAGWGVEVIERYVESVPEGETAVEAWIDDEGFARRVVSFDEMWALLDATDPPELEPITTTTEFFDFGLAADIEAPPAAEVIAWSELPDREE